MKFDFKKFLSYYTPYRKILFLDLFCAFCSSMIILVYPMLVNTVTTALTNSNSNIPLSFILKIATIFMFLAIIEYCCNLYVHYIGHVMGTKIEYDMRNELFNHFQKLSFSYYDNEKTGKLMSHITNDLFDITELAHHGPEDIIISIVKMLGSFVILLNVNVKLTLIIFAILPLMFIFAYYYNKKMKRAFKKNRQRIAEINNQIEDSLSGVRVVKSFANEHVEIEKFEVGNMNFVDSKKDSYKNMGKFHSGLSFFSSLINISVIIFGALFVNSNIIELTDLITFLLYINTLIDPIKRLIAFTEQFQNGATGFERFLEVIAIHPDIEDCENAIEIKTVKGEIEFKNVSFAYEGDKNKVLNNINLRVREGDYLALVGSSGVGKTTLCSLIPRFYDVTEGQIYLDGIDIKNIKLKSLREQIGIVQQDIYLFTGTIKENIAYGKPGATETEIIEAAINANAHEFITNLSEGYDTYIGQRGVRLSGGQKQRISIARVFLKNPPILIFDEATSALDNESEQIVQDSLEKLAKNRTTFVIAHRLSTIRNAKKILVLTEDGIAENGTHSELMKENGVYAKFYNLSERRTS